MKILAPLAAAVLSAAALLGTAGAQAQTAPVYYVAVPQAQPAKTSFVTRSAAWRYRGGAFVAAQAPERSQLLCQLVAENAGGLASFSVAGKAYDAEALAKCNAKVKSRLTDSAAIAR